MRQFRKSTIKEVAAKAGVSTATVSYLMSGRQSVCTIETAERIRAVESELNYAPNSLTRGLRNHSTLALGLCMISPSEALATEGSFFLERLLRGVTEEAGPANYAVLMYPGSERDSESCDAFLDGRVDGLLFHPHDNERTRRIAAAGMPTVLMTRSRDLPDGCGAVWADEDMTADLALSHLWDLGHRRIAHVAGPVGIHGTGGKPARDIAVQRMEGYTRWMTERGVFDPALIGYADAWTSARSPEMVATWIAMGDRRPTAVFCANDAQAMGLLKVATSAGLSIPRDLSVVGVDNSLNNRDTRPSLTSVDVPVERIGREAVRVLLRLMRGTPVHQCRTSIAVTDLVVGESTAPPGLSDRGRTPHSL